MPAETSMTLLTDPNFLALDFGAVVGLILALSGAGGGIIAVPLLVFGLKLAMQQGAPVGLMAVGLAATLGAAFGLRRGIVSWRQFERSRWRARHGHARRGSDADPQARGAHNGVRRDGEVTPFHQHSAAGRGVHHRHFRSPGPAGFSRHRADAD